MKFIKSIWSRLFLEERSSMSLSVFRMAVAFTVFAHVFPSLMHPHDNYLPTAFREFNASIFPVYILEWVIQSPAWVIYLFTGLFCLFSFCFFVGFLSQFSAIATMICCYYFYALNSFHVGTLSWDILLVTLFLMCLVPYHGDYFSVDSFLKGREGWRRKRPYFLQRLLQVQIAFTFFYTALWKIYPKGNWLQDNPIHYLMNMPPPGVTKWFLLRDVLRDKPEICYWIGVGVIVAEFLMLFLLFIRRTRSSAIYAGIFFHIVLILTLDVPATFFFLFPAQLLLFINPDHWLDWIEQKRAYHRSASRPVLLYDGDCRFCRFCVKRIQIMDMYARYRYTPYQSIPQLASIHPSLTLAMCRREVILVEPSGKIRGGIDALRRMSLNLPMMYLWIPLLYLPGMGILGSAIYRVIARNRGRIRLPQMS